VGGQNEKKLKSGFNFRSLWHMKCSAFRFVLRNAADFFYTENLVHSRYYYKKIGLLVDSERVCDLLENNTQCRMTDVGV